MKFPGPILLLLLLSACASHRTAPIPVQPNLEHRTADGGIFSPSTQSLLRHHHWLESVREVRMVRREGWRADFEFSNREDPPFVLKNIPLQQLVPRLYYPRTTAPDAFDALNLQLAEFSRNGIMVPIGGPGDRIAHYQTHLRGTTPYRSTEPYVFVPQPDYLPQRVQIVNNCLRAGLWEMGASDTAGEIYHNWFSLPDEVYLPLVGEVNGITDTDWLRRTLNWDDRAVTLDLDRLRRDLRPLGTVPLRVADEENLRYSSQDSRRKLQKGFVKIVDDQGSVRSPAHAGEITQHRVRLTKFTEPGFYDSKEDAEFDLRFLRDTRGQAEFFRVRPLTSYQPDRPAQNPADALEIHLHLRDRSILIGNLPIHLLVPQQEYSLDGFGVGVLGASEFAERRTLRIEQGPPPSFAYLAQRGEDGRWTGMNSHLWGLEQIFIRPHFTPTRSWLDITITSYERIVDIIRYEVDIPADLLPELLAARDTYTPPLFYTYRDDNLR